MNDEDWSVILFVFRRAVTNGDVTQEEADSAIAAIERSNDKAERYEGLCK